ncbi:MAG: SEC-C domain-containing protein [Peptoniphilaceae bacterium]|nr:SEC-C domain-containing protein [Peptoniphilaceae bacterium]MDY3075506.1 SEC-C domain-containing protein [Peptoniphilaceae bacterium]
MLYPSIQEQIDVLVKEQPDMLCTVIEKGFHVEGEYHYALNAKDVSDQGSRWITIIVPNDYPSKPLTLMVKELPQGMSHVNIDGTACVATQGEIIQFLTKKPSIKDYIERFVHPFLFTIDWFEKYGTYPFGERAHGYKGSESYYREEWGLNKTQYLLLVDLVFNRKYRGHLPCICGSGKKMRDCHGGKILPIVMNEKLRQMFLAEAADILQEEEKSAKRIRAR